MKQNQKISLLIKKMTPLCLQQEEIQQSARISNSIWKKVKAFKKRDIVQNFYEKITEKLDFVEINI